MLTKSFVPMISIVVPALDERDNLEVLVDAVFHAMLTEPRGFELILVDDGSRDGSRHLLRQLSATRPWLRCLFLARRYGQSTALQAGFDHARGTYIVTMDG